MQRPILLVEDSPDDAELTTLALERSNVANPVVLKRDGVEALDYLFGREGSPALAPHELPQIVILDLKLPRVGGLEVLQQIRSRELTRHLPVVVLTSSNEDQDVVRSYRLGVNAYVTKPVEFENFSKAVIQLGLFWLLVNVHPSDHTG